VSLVGKNIDAYCTKCKLLLTHIVLFEMDGVVSKVECKTCGSQHKYRRGASERKTGEKVKRSPLTGRTGSSSAGRKPVNDAPMLWEIKNRDANPEAPIREYRMQDKYKSKEMIQHPTFGLGFVERVTSETRMNVLFKDAVKLMAMNVR
jgi:hypothetical protein